MEELRKDAVYTAEVTGCTSDGDGVVRLCGRAVFVPGALMNETIRVRITKVGQNVCLGEVVEWLERSPEHTEPECPLYDRCGGCRLMHMTYAEELRVKRRRVADALRRIGGLELEPEAVLAPGRHLGYRNKAVFGVSMEAGKPVTGFYAERTRQVVPAAECLIQHPVTNSAAAAVRQWMEECGVPAYRPETGRGLVRRVFCRVGEGTGEVQAAVVTGKDALPARERLIELLRARVPGLKSVLWNVNSTPGNTVFGGSFRLLWGEEWIEDTLCSLRFRLSANSFYQVNHDRAELLYETALELANLTGKETALDLCCGTGTITLLLAKRAGRAIGVEIVPEAVEDAKNNARRNGVENAEFLCADVAEAAPTLLRQGIRPQVVMLDPPRKGLPEAAILAAAEMEPDRIVYVSCDPATLARDLRRFAGLGYEAKRAIPVDLFPRTAHVETVVLLSQQRPNDKIRVELDLTEFDITAAEKEAPYQEIKDYILEKYGVKVSSLYIAQTKEKMGIKERENYNLPKNEDAKQPQCPIDKE